MATSRSAVAASEAAFPTAEAPRAPGIAAPPQGGPARPALPWLQTPLAQLQAMRQSHAWLLHGPAGVGQFELGVAWAQTLLCEADGEPWQRLACGHCEACRLVLHRSHPDLRILLPEALSAAWGWLADDDLARLKKANPSREIRIDAVRSAIDWSHLTNARGRAKVLLVHPAEAMNVVTANGLLKTLEEPPGALRIVLCSADPQHLLPTIRSRCQQLVLGRPEPLAALAALEGRGLQQPAALLRLAGGSPGRALDWLDAGWPEPLLLSLPQALAAHDAAALSGRPLPQVIDLLLRLAHDALALAHDAPPLHTDAAVWPQARLDAAAIRRWIADGLLPAARHPDHGWNAPLLLDSLLTQAGAIWPTSHHHGSAPKGRTYTASHG